MQKMTAPQLIELIEKENLKPFFHDLEWEYLTEEYSDDYGSHRQEEDLFGSLREAEQFIKSTFGEFEQVAYRCDSSEMYSVIHFKDHDVYLRFTGYFNSYDMCSHSYESPITQVIPREVVAYEFDEKPIKTAPFNFDEIVDILEDSGISVSSFAYGDFSDSQLTYPLGEWTEVARGGGMDKGSDWYSVKYFKDHDIYIKTNGWYQSHYGTDFDDGYGQQVIPQQKTITIYE